MGPIGCPGNSARNYRFSLRNDPEERSSYLLRGGSLKSRMRCCLFWYVYYVLLKCGGGRKMNGGTSDKGWVRWQAAPSLCPDGGRVLRRTGRPQGACRLQRYGYTWWRRSVISKRGAEDKRVVACNGGRQIFICRFISGYSEPERTANGSRRRSHNDGDTDITRVIKPRTIRRT